MSVKNYAYIEPSELRERLGDEKVCVVDVRDDDYNVDGHIPGASNVPSELWDNTEIIDELVRSHAGSLMDTVVFHCRLSQVRGPSCATMYLERQRELLACSVDTPKV